MLAWAISCPLPGTHLVFKRREFSSALIFGSSSFPHLIAVVDHLVSPLHLHSRSHLLFGSPHCSILLLRFLTTWILPLRVFWLALRLHHHVKQSSTPIAYPSVHHLAIFVRSHTDNLNSYGFIG